MVRKSLFLIIVLIQIQSCSNPSEPLLAEPNRFPASGSYAGDYWPTTAWRYCAPAQVGMDSTRLMNAYAYASRSEIYTEALLVIKNGYIVGEAYFNGYDSTTTFPSYSIAKSFSSALIGIAIDKGMVDSVEAKVYPFFPDWNQDQTPPIKKRIGLNHLLTMTSGLEWNEITDRYDLNAMVSSEDYVNYVLSRTVSHEPGTYWQYSNGSPMLLSAMIEGFSGKKAFDFGYDHLFKPIGAADIQWQADPAGHTIASWGIFASLHNYARFGYLYLKNGIWDRKQLISSEWISESTRQVLTDINFYSYLWWLPPAFENYSNFDIPSHTFIAVGASGQYLYVVPEKQLLIIRLGNDDSTSLKNWSTLKFLDLVLAAIDPGQG